MKWKHKNIYFQQSAGNVLVPMFQESRDVILNDYLDMKKTITEEYYIVRQYTKKKLYRINAESSPKEFYSCKKKLSAHKSQIAINSAI